jgi:Fe-S-cluster-containing dehydrogenase component
VHDEGHIDKCSFCMHRVQRGELPACVSICPTTSLHFGDLNDPRSEVSRLLSSRAHRVLQPELGTDCNVFFLE